MRQPEHFLGRWLWFAVCALVIGTALFVFGYWCLDSTNIPPPSFALPLPQRLLTGLGFILVMPFLLIPLALILTASRFLTLKLSRASSAAVVLAGFAFILVGTLWVPNPVVFWPISVLGEHTVPELICELFAFHIVPAPKGSYASPDTMQSLLRWQLLECGVRWCLLMIGWIASLVTIWKIDRRLSTVNNSLQATAAPPCC
jgi:hypothetical protein